MAAEIDTRIAEFEAALAALPDGDKRQHGARTQLAGALIARFFEHGGAEDRVRAQQLAQTVLADPAAGVEERQRMGLLLATVTMLVATPAAALLEHPRTAGGQPKLDDEALRRTEEWRRTVDPATAAAGVAMLIEQLDAIPDIGSLPPQVRAQIEMMRQIVPLMGPDDDPATAQRLTTALEQAPLDLPGVELLRPLAISMREGAGAQRIAELEQAIADLADDHLLTPMLQRDLARALIGATGENGVDGLRRAAHLLERAAGGMSADNELYDDTVRQLAGLLVSLAATDTTPQAIERAERVAAEVLAQPGAGAADRRGSDLFLRSLVGLLKSAAGDGRDEQAAVSDLIAAIDALPGDHALRPVAVGQLGALLADRHLTKGMLENLDAAQHILDEAATVAQDPETRAFLTALTAVSRVNQSIRANDPGVPVTAADALRTALADLPDQHPLRGNLNLVLALADLKASMSGGDVAAAMSTLRQVTAEGVFPGVPDGVVASILGQIDVLRGMLGTDPAAIVDAINRLEEQVARSAGLPIHQAGQRAMLGKSYLAAHDLGIHPEVAATRAVIHLEAALRTLNELRAGVPEADVLRDLAAAHRRTGDHERSRQYMFTALAAHASAVLLQTGVAHAVVTARGAAEDAAKLAHWCLADGDVAGAVQAVELGRGLTLHAATSALRVPRVLADVGQPQLAMEWQADAAARRADPAPWTLAEAVAGGADGRPTDYVRAAADLRHRVLEVLRGTAEGQRLFTAPSTAAIGEALSAVGRDALVYLLPGDGEGAAESVGSLLVVDRGGTATVVPAPRLRIEPDGPAPRFRAAAETAPAAWRAALSDVCDWGGSAVLEPLLAALGSGPKPARIVLVPSGVLGAVPWPAAHLRAGRTGFSHACAEAVLSTAASARQFIEATSRVALPAQLEPVLLADPLGGLPFAMDEVLALQEALYPNAVVLGDFRGVEPADADDGPVASGVGSPQQILDRLPGARRLGASMLHLACHALAAPTVESSYLELTERLTIRDVLEHAAGRVTTAPGPLVVLSSCQSDLTERDDDEALTLATSLLAAGAVTVIGSRWSVEDQRTTILMFALHHFLTALGQEPADALRSAQLWMLDPERAELPGMPEALCGDMDGADLTDVTVWAAFGHHGR